MEKRKFYYAEYKGYYILEKEGWPKAFKTKKDLENYVKEIHKSETREEEAKKK